MVPPDINDRMRLEIRNTAYRQAAMIADEMAADCEEQIANGVIPEEDVDCARRAIRGYLMIGKLIRRLELDD